jgi:hypothetical protein
VNHGGNWIEKLGRAGLLAQGFSYGLVGLLAIELALGKGGKTTSREGALKTLADSTFGKIVIVLLALGFAGYAAWRLAQALFDRGGEGSDPKALGKRAAQLAKGALYAGLAISALSILFGWGSRSPCTCSRTSGGCRGSCATRLRVDRCGGESCWPRSASASSWRR